MRKSGSPAQEATVFLNARLIDPASGKDEPGGLLVKDGVIADLGQHLRRNAPERSKRHRLQGPRAVPRPDRHAGVHRRARPGAPRDLEDGQPRGGGRRRHHHRRHAGHRARHRPGGAGRLHPAPRPRQRHRQRARHGGHDARPQGRGDDGDRPAQAGRRHRLHQRQVERGQRARHAQRAALRQGPFDPHRASHGRPPPHRGRGDECRRGGDAARPARRQQGGRDDRARARRAPRRAHRRPLPRGHAVVRGEPGRGARRQGAQAARDVRRVDQSPHAERERHRLLPHLPAPEAAAARRGRPLRHGARPRRRRHRRDRLQPRSAGRRRQAPSLRRSRRRRHRAGDAARGRPAPLPQRRDRPAAAAARHDHQPGQAAGPALRTPREGRTGRPDPGRPRPALGGGPDAAQGALQELAVRREPDAGPRAHHHGCRQHRLPIRCRRRA